MSQDIDKKIQRSTVIGMILVSLICIIGTFVITYTVMVEEVKKEYTNGHINGMKQGIKEMSIAYQEEFLFWEKQHKLLDSLQKIHK